MLNSRTRDIAQWRTLLAAGLKRLNLAVDEGVIDQLLDYLLLIQKWNKSINLTAIDDMPSMIERHLLDSLAIRPWVTESTVMDVGTGAGLPAIPMAIVNTHQQWLAVDSSRKRVNFLSQVCRSLELDNGATRVWAGAGANGYRQSAAIISRAFASLADMTHNSHQHLLQNGCFWAMKGRYPSDELAQLDARFVVVASHDLSHFAGNAERHLIQLKFSSD